MLDKNSFIVKESLRKSPRYIGELNKVKLYRASCDSCGRDRGYKKIDSLCLSCASVKRLKMETPTQQAERINKRTNTLNSDPSIVQRSVQKATETKKRRGIAHHDEINRCIAARLRNRLSKAINRDLRLGSAVRDLGCSVMKFRIHLQLLWYRRRKNNQIMGWDNYGLGGWHIDHIIPLTKFDLADPAELKKACHYTNLQPLWAEDNLKKGAS